MALAAVYRQPGQLQLLKLRLNLAVDRRPALQKRHDQRCDARTLTATP
jgi:hypothetical protein